MTSPVHREAAGHADDLARQECSIIAREERDEGRDVVRLAETLERDGALQTLVNLLAGFALAEERREQRCVGRAGAYDVDVDPRRGKLACEAFRERDDASLARGIDRFT